MGAWPTPWFVTGAVHDAQVARLLAYAAMRGQGGVLGPLDCRVLELETPGAGVRVMPGGVNVLARGFTNTRQSYPDYLPSQDIAPIEATTASGPRSDLVVARVEDPEIPGGGWTWNPATEPVMHTRVIPNVPPTTIDVQQVEPGLTAETFCRVDIPGGPSQETGTITQAMITDLRQIADLSGQRLAENVIADELFTNNKHLTQNWGQPGTNPQQGLWDTVSSYIDWPADAQWSVPVPTWATGADIILDFNPKALGYVWGYARLVINGVAGNPTGFDDQRAESTGRYRTNIKVGGTYGIPASARGKVVTFKVQMRQREPELSPGQDLGNLVTGENTYCTFWVRFQRRPSYT